MAEFTGREKLHIAAGLCGWEVRPECESGEDLLWHSDYRWIRVRYDSMGRIREAVDHAQIGDGGPMIEQNLEPGPDRAEQVIHWLTRLQ